MGIFSKTNYNLIINCAIWLIKQNKKNWYQAQQVLIHFPEWLPIRKKQKTYKAGWTKQTNNALLQTNGWPTFHKSTDEENPRCTTKWKLSLLIVQNICASYKMKILGYKLKQKQNQWNQTPQSIPCLWLWFSRNIKHSHEVFRAWKPPMRYWNHAPSLPHEVLIAWAPHPTTWGADSVGAPFTPIRKTPKKKMYFKKKGGGGRKGMGKGKNG